MTSEQSKGNNSNSKERQKKINRSAVVNKKHFKELTKYKHTVIDTTIPKFINLFSSKANLLGRTTR